MKKTISTTWGKKPSIILRRTGIASSKLRRIYKWPIPNTSSNHDIHSMSARVSRLAKEVAIPTGITQKMSKRKVRAAPAHLSPQRLKLDFSLT